MAHVPKHRRNNLGAHLVTPDVLSSARVYSARVAGSSCESSSEANASDDDDDVSCMSVNTAVSALDEVVKAFTPKDIDAEIAKRQAEITTLQTFMDVAEGPVKAAL